MKTSYRRLTTIVVLLTFLFSIVPWEHPPASAQEALQLPEPGVMVPLSPGFAPLSLKGIKVNPQDPFKFDFILDQGDQSVNEDQLRKDSSRLLRYFLAGLTIPEKDLWVNLSPYEKDRIIPDEFGFTEMGRDLLAQDYLLKQLTASIIYPKERLGKKFWKRVYERAFEEFGSTDIPVNSFNKVWIVPDQVQVFENNDTAFIVESRLKVLLDSDYLAVSNNQISTAGEKLAGASNELSRDVLRQVVIPELEREVNEGKNFVLLRQVYQSLVLAVWFKRKVRESILSQVYVDQKRMAGLDLVAKDTKEEIWGQYVLSFKKGVYSYIREEPDPLTQEMIPRRYFSGGVFLGDLAMSTTSSRGWIAGLKGAAGMLVLSIALSTGVSAKESSGRPALKSESHSAVTSEKKYLFRPLFDNWLERRKDRISVEYYSVEEWKAHLEKEGQDERFAGFCKLTPYGIQIEMSAQDKDKPYLLYSIHELLHAAHFMRNDPAALAKHLLAYKNALHKTGNRKALAAFYKVINYFKYDYDSPSRVIGKLLKGELSPEQAEETIDQMMRQRMDQMIKGAMIKEFSDQRAEQRGLARQIMKQVFDPNYYGKPTTISDGGVRLIVTSGDSPLAVSSLRDMPRDGWIQERENLSSPSVATEFFAYYMTELARKMSNDVGPKPQRLVPQDKLHQEALAAMKVLVESQTNETKAVLEEHWSHFDFPSVFAAMKNAAGAHSFDEVKEKSDNAQLGGIDLTAERMDMDITGRSGIRFDQSPEMIERLKTLPGLSPVVVDIRPLNNLAGFLGLGTSLNQPQPSFEVQYP